MFITICVYCGQTFDSNSGDTFMEVCDECVEYPGEDTDTDTDTLEYEDDELNNNNAYRDDLPF